MVLSPGEFTNNSVQLPNGKELWIIIQYPQKNPDHHQNPTTSVQFSPWSP